MTHAIRSLAFPAISTGVYGYPVEAAAEIAVNTVREAAANRDLHILFACFDAHTREAYARLLAG